MRRGRAAEAAIRDSRPAGDCETLRRYLEQFPSGAYAEEAQRRLQAASREPRETWTREQRVLPLTIRTGLDPFPDQAAAREDARTRAAEQARLVCAGFDTGEFRLTSAAAEVQQWQCRPRESGIVCGFDGRARCDIEVRSLGTVEICPQGAVLQCRTVMPTRENKSISFTPEQAAFVDACVSSGRYQSASEVVREGLRLLERAEQSRLFEKWLYEDLTEDERARLDPGLLEKARRHVQGLVDEGLRSAAGEGWIDGDKAMRRLRTRLDT